MDTSGILCLMSYEAPVGFDSFCRIEGESTDMMIGRRLIEHVSVEAFTNGRDEPGNYIIEVRTTLSANLPEREKIAGELGIDVRPSAIPYLPDQMSDPLISRIGFELRNSILLRPRPLGTPAPTDIAHALGIGAEWWQKDREHGLRVRLSVGMAAVSQGMERLGIDNVYPYETPETQYETEELAQAVEVGRVLVCKRPDIIADVDIATIFLWPLHDNVFHLYSNILLQTPEFTEFVRAHGANRRPGALDGHLAAAGARLHRMSAQDWYSFTTTTQAPYRQFRHFLHGFIDPESEGAVRLKEEIAAMESVDDILGKEGFDKAAEDLLRSNRAIIDRPGNMLDQLNPVVSSIIARFVQLNP